MMFGLCNAPATFQTFMDTELADLIDTGHVVIYLDDILIFAHTISKVIKYTHMVLQHLLDLDLYLQPAKCSFNQTSIEYLGLIIRKENYTWTLSNSKPFHPGLCQPKSRIYRNFLAFVKFIDNSSKITPPLPILCLISQKRTHHSYGKPLKPKLLLHYKTHSRHHQCSSCLITTGHSHSSWMQVIT